MKYFIFINTDNEVHVVKATSEARARGILAMKNFDQEMFDETKEVLDEVLEREATEEEVLSYYLGNEISFIKDNYDVTVVDAPSDYELVPDSYKVNFTAYLSNPGKWAYLYKK